MVTLLLRSVIPASKCPDGLSNLVHDVICWSPHVSLSQLETVSEKRNRRRVFKLAFIYAFWMGSGFIQMETSEASSHAAAAGIFSGIFSGIKAKWFPPLPGKSKLPCCLELLFFLRSCVLQDFLDAWVHRPKWQRGTTAEKSCKNPTSPTHRETNNQPTHRLEYLEGSHTQDFGSGTMLGVSRMLCST